MRSAQWLAIIVKRRGNLTDNVARHISINLIGNLDEARIEIQRLQFPRKVKWINGNAMPTQTWTRIKRHVTKGLSLRRFNDLPHINSKLVTHDCNLINKADVNRPKCIFQQFNHFSRLRGRY